MKKKLENNNISFYMLCVILSIALLGIIIGSICDLQISKAIYISNSFFIYYVEYISTFPVALLCSLIGVFLFLYFNHNKKIKYSNIYKYLVLLIIPVCGAIWGYDSLSDAFGKKIYAIGIGAITVIPFSYLFYLYYKRKYDNSFARVALIIALASITSIVITFGLKLMFDRPRFYYMKEVDTDFSLYKNWYNMILRFIDKTSYPNLEKNTYIQSFPSGHSSFASLLYLLLLLPYNKKNVKYRHITFVVVTAYIILIMLGRIRNGRHFLTDVSFAYLISSTITMSYIIFIPNDLFNRKEKVSFLKDELTEKL